MYLDGLSDEEEIPFRIEQGPQRRGGESAAPEGMVTRQVDAVIDLDAMRAELEANPAARVRR